MVPPERQLQTPLLQDWGAEHPPQATVRFTPQLSVAVTLPTLGAGAWPLHWIVMAAGQVMLGGVLSITVTVCEAEEVLPQTSIAVHTRMRVYAFGQLPGVVVEVGVTVTMPEQLSVAVKVAWGGTALH